MAEFRKLFYAFGLAAMLAGVSSTANAQTTICTASSVPTTIRTESFADLVGDTLLDCTGGQNTPAGAEVPRVNVTVTLSTNITSKLLASGVANSNAGNWSEALLIIDEPNSALNPAVPLLACGQTGAPDTGAPGAGVCSIISTGVYTQTYNGATGSAGTLACNGQDPDGTAGPLQPLTPTTFGCGRPNVFQGRQGLAQNQGNSNIIVFAGVPFDPPGVNLDNPAVIRHRYLRVTNIRANAPPVAAGFLLQTVVMNVNITGTQPITIINPSPTVAAVQIGIQGPVVTTAGFVQCVGRTAQDSVSNPTVRFREGFQSSFKVKGVEETLANGEYNGSSWVWNTDLLPSTASGSAPGYAPGLRQNVPGAAYNTESGFVSHPDYANPSPNPPPGFGTVPVTGGNAISNNQFIQNAGIATQGTRIAVTFRDLPAGVTVSVRPYVPLVLAGSSTVTGVAVRTNTASIRGDGPFSAFSLTNDLTVVTGDQITYEVLFSDPNALEDLLIQTVVSFTTNSLSSDLPEVNKTAQVAGGFAPYILSTDSATTWGQAQFASATVQGGASPLLPVPRFRTQSSFQDLFSIVKCSCNLLFPFVSNAASSNGNYDTGIALANTSLTPGAASTAAQRFGFRSGTSQEGPVQFWYYPANSTDPPVATQCTNTTATGVCPGTKNVKAGETLLYVLSQGSAQWGLKAAPGFTGYVIAQAGFQYCHAFAYISPQGATPLTNGMSVGYVALVLDKEQLPSRTQSLGESLGH